MKVRIISPSIDEIAEAALWLNEQAEGLGNEFWQLVDAALSQKSENPLRFGRSEFASDDHEFRFAYVERFKYVFHFLVDNVEVLIITVSHAAREPGYWLLRVRTP